MEAGRTRSDLDRLRGLDVKRLSGMRDLGDFYRLGAMGGVPKGVGRAVVLEDTGQQHPDRQPGEEGSRERRG